MFNIFGADHNYCHLNNPLLSVIYQSSNIFFKSTIMAKAGTYIRVPDKRERFIINITSNIH